jgi:hypothetical protein
MARGRPQTLEDVYQILDAIEPDEYGCKPWPRKYGLYPVVRVSGTQLKVSRIVLERKLGRKIRPGFFALHTCDYPPCVNVDHLYEGTTADNKRDMKERNPGAWDLLKNPQNLARLRSPENLERLAGLKRRWSQEKLERLRSPENLERLARGRETQRKRRRAKDLGGGEEV